MLRNGPVAKPRGIFEVRELRKEDLARLYEPRRVPVVRKIRDSHHHIAKLFASGLNAAEVARRTGRHRAAMSMLRKDPAFSNLVAEYRDIATAAWAEGVDDYFELACGNMVRAELQIADRLAEAEEAGETLPVRDLLAISRDAADRFGYGKKQTNLNVNADFAALLEKAIRRSGKEIAPQGAPREQRAMGEVAMSLQPHASPPCAEGAPFKVIDAIAEQGELLRLAKLARGEADPPSLPAGETVAPTPPAATVSPFIRRRA
jgi:hypothetical protein